MNVITRPTAAVILLLLSTFLTTAQQKRQTPAKPPAKAPAAAPTPAPTFDTLVPANSYVIYGEVRGAGQLIRSGAINELLEPVMKLTGPPKDFKSIVKFLKAHSEELMTSRLLVATWPTNGNVPDVMIGIEFSSAEESTRFENSLNEFLPTILDRPTAEPAAKTETDSSAPAPKSMTPIRPTFHLKRFGSFVVLSPRPWTTKQLRPAGSKLLAEDFSFRAARNRFNSEPVFVFFDVKTMKREEEERRKYYEEMERTEARQARRERARQLREKREAEQKTESAEPEQAPAPELITEVAVTPPAEPAKEASTPDPLTNALSGLAPSFFGGDASLPDGVGIALSYEGDSFDLRALFISAPGEKSDAIPFWPRMIPGAAIAPESANVLPANTELFLTMSLDLPQIYAVMSKPPAKEYTVNQGTNVSVNKYEIESPFAAIENRLKINIKYDLLPLLGSEITVSLPMHNMNMLGLPAPLAPRTEPKPGAAETQPTETAPFLLIAVKDKEQLRALMPKLVDALGFKGASSFAQTERREDTEFVSYMNVFAYAFVGNLLVLSGDPATTRRVVDSYLKHETLGADAHFKNSTRWQPRQLHGQIYISPSLMEGFKTWAGNTSLKLSDPARAYLTSVSMFPQPVTYSLSNEGFGPFHELHLPKNLVLMAVAGISGEINPPEPIRNERMAVGLMFQIIGAQNAFKEKPGGGNYGTLDQLSEAGLISKEMFENSGYRFDVTVSGDKFEVSAVPAEYGKTGTRSLFTDQTRVIRGGDRNGAASTVSDPPIY